MHTWMLLHFGASEMRPPWRGIESATAAATTVRVAQLLHKPCLHVCITMGIKLKHT